MKSLNQIITEQYRFVTLSQKPVETLTEAEVQFLNEQRIAHLKAANPTIDTSHDTNAKLKDAGDIIDHFAEHGDPSKNKQHTQKIMKWYKDKTIRQEDAPRVKQALTDFDTYKPKLANKDLNSYKKLSDVEDAVAPHLGTHATKAAETKAVKHEGADKVYEDDDISIHHIKTHAAACHYGSGTKWCTASKDDPSMFDHYSGDGPIHVINDKKTGRKFQFHHASNQFMDEKDNEISKEDFNSIKKPFHKAIDKHPEIVGAHLLD